MKKLLSITFLSMMLFAVGNSLSAQYMLPGCDLTPDPWKAEGKCIQLYGELYCEVGANVGTPGIDMCFTDLIMV